MIKVFKEKPPQLQAIEVTSVLNQLPEVATLIGAYQAGVTLDGDVQVGNFIVLDVDGQSSVSHQVREGQVIAIADGVITVKDATEFYAKYEAI